MLSEHVEIMDRSQQLADCKPLAMHYLDLQGEGWMSAYREMHGPDIFFLALSQAIEGVAPNYLLEAKPVIEIEKAIQCSYHDVPSLERSLRDHEIGMAMNRRIFHRERSRREALWKLEFMRPGDPAAASVLEVLDGIEASEIIDPLGAGAFMSLEDLRGAVEVVSMEGRIPFVKSTDIPQPWRERCSQASYGSTRSMDGPYSHDWYKFLSLWAKEMDHLSAHRLAPHHGEKAGE